MGVRSGSRDRSRAGGGTAGDSRTTCPRRRRAVTLLLAVAAALVLSLGFAPSAMAAPVQFFYVPFPEEDILAMLGAVESGGPSDAPAEPVTTYVTITTIADGTIIYYDQWENGYDVDIANTLDTYHAVNNPDGTQIWGDGNTANGAPPGIPTDLIDAGVVIQLQNDVTTTTRQSVIDFDGGDKIAATKTIALTRTSWAAVTSTLFAGCVEVFDTNNWGTEYRSPVGVDLADNVDYQMFEYTALSIMAGEAGATIQVDTNNDGDFDDSGDLDGVELKEGESTHVTDVYVGAHVVSDNPVQVDIFSGDIQSNYESRDSALLPTHLWASRYYTPVSTPNVGTNAGDERTTVWLYNSGTSAITVTYERRDTSGNRITSTVSVPAGGAAKQILENATDGTGSVFYTSGAPFYAYSTTDSAGTSTSEWGYYMNQAWDWSFTMIPDTMLTTQALVGLGLGQDPTLSITENGNPIWVTTVGNGDDYATVYVDYDADPDTGPYTDPNGNGYDASYNLRELEQARIYVPAPTSDIVVDATSSGTTGTGTSSATLDIPHTTGTDSDRLMLVSVAIANDSGIQRNVSGVTYGGYSLQLVGRQLARTGGGGDGSTVYLRPQVEIWALADPPSGSGTVRVTLTGTKAFVAGVTTFSGVDVSDGLTSALGGFASAEDNAGRTQTVDVTTTAGQLVFDVVGAGVNARGTTADPSAFTAGAGQTQLWTQSAQSEDGRRDRHIRGAGSIETATGSTTTMSWTTTTSYPWAIGAVPINPVSSGDPIRIDQTGLLVYTLDTDVKLAVAWGQDPWTSTAGAPGLDVGTSVPPTPEFTAGKDGTLFDDNDGDGYLSPGDEMEYPITVYNVSRVPVPDVVVWDEVPEHTSYVPGTTVLSRDDDGDGIYETNASIADDDPLDPDYYTDLNGTVYPLDGLGYNAGTMPVGGSIMATFNVLIDGYDDLPEGTLAILNDGVASALGWDDPVDDKAFLRGRIGDYVWYDTDMDGIQDAGEMGIEGIVVQLLDGLGNPLYDRDGELMTMATDSTGFYEFTGLPPGDYMVWFDAPDGAGFSPQDAGADDVDSDPNATTGYTGVITLNGGQRIRSVDAGLYRITPTVVVVNSFDATLVDGKVVVSWETGSEADTAGFYVERLDGEQGRWARVSDELVPALLESPTGGTYSLVDGGAQPGQTYSYRLVEMEMTGLANYYGPYEAAATQPLYGGKALDEVAAGGEVVRVPRPATESSHAAVHVVEEQLLAGTTTGDRLRIEVDEAGLYRIGAGDLAAGLGISEEQAAELIRTKGVKLTNQGRNVAYLQAADYTALFFYGQALDSIYDTTNVYWLTPAKGSTMVAAKNSTAKKTVLTTFVDRLHVEEDVFPITERFHQPDGDYWLWSYLAAGFAPLATQTFTVEVPDTLAGVQLQVVVRGLTVTGVANEHHATVRLNGVVLGDTWWSGMVTHRATFAIPAGALNAGANEVAVTAVLDGGVAYSLFAVDSIDVSYQRETVATADQLTLKAPATGLVEASGLTTADAWILDLSNPVSPQVIRAASSGGDSGAAWLRFSAVKGRQYLVATAAGALTPSSITPTNGTALRSAGTGAEYLVITTPELAEAAGRLAAYRAGQGLSALVVTTDEIYDEFNYGLAGPYGIRNFIKYAATSWKTTPRYVVLAGEGSFDYKDHMGRGDSLVPPLMVDTEYGLAPSDVALADVRGADGAPDVAIGRIPVLTGAELDAALAEIQTYEAAGGPGGSSSVLVAADDTDTGGSFMSDGEVMAGILPASLNVVKAYLEQSSAAEVRAALLRALADGTALIDYVGHGGEDLLADESLLTTADVASLPAGARLPIVAVFTCKVGQYGLPGYDSLGEALVKQQGSGAIGVWAPSTMEDSKDSARLGALFHQVMFGASTEVVLGDAIRSAMNRAASEGLPLALLQTYNLLGDPALRVGW